jgi:N-dimethylarginine dimethylaminohydrolase
MLLIKYLLYFFVMQPKINKTVLMSGADYFDDSQAINAFMDSAKYVNRPRAIHEHFLLRIFLEQVGITVVQVSPPVDCQDGVYTANWALVRGEKAIMANLPNVRQGELATAERVLKGLGKKIYKPPKGLRFSGQGDGLACGNYLFMNHGYRSDLEMHQFVADTLGYEVISLQTVPLTDDQGKPVINAVSGWPDSYFYDIDLALSVLKGPQEHCTHRAQALDDSTLSRRGPEGAVSEYGDVSTAAEKRADAKEASGATSSAGRQADCPECRGLIAWCPEAFTPESRAKLTAFDAVDKIEVSLEEAMNAFACNLLSTGDAVVMSAHAPKLRADVEAHGLIN